MMQETAKSTSDAIKNSISLEKNHPWILQVFVKCDSDFSSSMEPMRRDRKLVQHDILRLTEKYSKLLRLLKGHQLNETSSEV